MTSRFANREDPDKIIIHYLTNYTFQGHKYTKGHVIARWKTRYSLTILLRMRG